MDKKPQTDVKIQKIKITDLEHETNFAIARLKAIKKSPIFLSQS